MFSLAKKVLRNCKLKHEIGILKNQLIYSASTSISKDGYVEVAELSNGRKVKFEVGGLARLADGAAVASIGHTSVLVTAVSKGHSGPPANFIPLTVDYRQKYAAAGRIPSNYLRRELAPTEQEILTSRIIDRSLRPLFPIGYQNDTQLTCQLMAVDGLHDPDVVSINAASVALAVSDIPWLGPIGSVRVGLIDGEVIIFPTRKELSHSNLNLVVTAADKMLVVMLGGSGNVVLEQDLRKAIRVGVKECQLIIQTIKNIAKLYGKTKRGFAPAFSISEELLTAAKSLSETRICAILSDASHNKLSRDNAVSALRYDIIQKLQESFPKEDSYNISEAYNIVVKSVFRNLILDNHLRCDGRSLEDLRPISCAVDLHEPLHGSALFQRGQTQVQCTVAFDSPEKASVVDPLLEATGGIKDRNFLLHYSFPSFSTNDLSKGGSITRREVGHGALAEKGLRPILPSGLPFSVLLTSTVFESNGSSSMATVCGGTLALMDAGVNISEPAAGVAIGLVSKTNQQGHIDNYQVLTDILGIEDYMGDMDFKIAGTKKGITALQADIKLPGVPVKIIMESIDQSTRAKLKILSLMAQVISKPRDDKQGNRPSVETIDVPPHKRGRLAGPGGINLKKIQMETGVQLNWQDDHVLSIFSTRDMAMQEAKELISNLLEDKEPNLEFGAIYNAKIVEVKAQGVMVTLYDNMSPVLLHNSQLDSRKVNHPSVLGLDVGQEIKVKYFGRDPTSGHMRLSRRALQAVNTIKNLHKQELSS